MESLPNNSEKAQLDKKPVATRKVEQIEGSAAQHKPTFWKMLKASFIPENMTVMDVIADMVMPAIRDGMFDMASGTIDYIRSGVGGYPRYDRSRDPRSRNYRQTDYRSASTGSRYDRRYEDDHKQASSRASSYDDVVLYDTRNNKGEFVSGARRAAEVLSMCDDDIRQYGYCRVSDFLEHCKLPASPNGSDYNWGWANLDRATYKPVRGGAMMIMPEALHIED